MDTQQYVGIDEVAKYYSVSVSTVRGWVKKKIIPPECILKISKTYRFRLADLDVALRSAAAGTPATKEAAKTPVQLELDFNPDEDV